MVLVLAPATSSQIPALVHITNQALHDRATGQKDCVALFDADLDGIGGGYEIFVASDVANRMHALKPVFFDNAKNGETIRQAGEKKDHQENFELRTKQQKLSFGQGSLQSYSTSGRQPSSGPLHSPIEAHSNGELDLESLTKSVSETLVAWLADGRFRVVVARDDDQAITDLGNSNTDGMVNDDGSRILGYAAWSVRGYEESAVDYLNEGDEDSATTIHQSQQARSKHPHMLDPRLGDGKDDSGNCGSTPWSAHVQSRASKAFFNSVPVFPTANIWAPSMVDPHGVTAIDGPLVQAMAGSSNSPGNSIISPPPRHHRLAALILAPIPNCSQRGTPKANSRAHLTPSIIVGRLIRWGTRGADMWGWECWTRLPIRTRNGDERPMKSDKAMETLLQRHGFETVSPARSKNLVSPDHDIGSDAIFLRRRARGAA